MNTTLLSPPAEITWWHARWLEPAAAEHLRYDLTRYPIHGVSNNVAGLIWMGLLADSPAGPVITPLGQALLDTYRANQPAAAAPALSAPKAESHPPRPTPAYEQPDLFATT